MFVGLRECNARSNPCIVEVKIPFDLNIIIFTQKNGSLTNSRFS